MTTPDASQGRQAGAIPEELLSVESIARLANEFFRGVGVPVHGATVDLHDGVKIPTDAPATEVNSQSVDSGAMTDVTGESASPARAANALNSPSSPATPIPSGFGAKDIGGLGPETFDVDSLGLSTSLITTQPGDVDAHAVPVDPAGDGADSIGTGDQLMKAALAEMPAVDFVAERVVEHPADVTEAVDYALGDHPFLESKYNKALAEFELTGFPSGDEFTGHDSTVLDGLPGFVQGVSLAEQFADALNIPEAFDAPLVDQLTQDEYATSVPLFHSDDLANESKDDARTLGQPVSGQGESAYLPDEVVANTVAPVDRLDVGSDAANPQIIEVEDRDEFSPTVVPAVPVKDDIFDAERIREDFPILCERVHGQRIAWLDNGATTQKPQSVIDRISYFYEHENSNVHRTAHTLAGRATDAYEGAREKIRRFINASSTDEIVYVRGATEGMNLIANTFGEQNVCEGDEILISCLEHHANIVPWQMLCARKGAKLKVAPVDDSGQVILSEYERLITPRTKLISFTQVSNALGTITPAAEMIEIAHRHGVPVVLDGAQGVLHMRVDVQSLKPDFFVFSGHKMFGPTGIGVVYGRMELLEKMPPWQGGGNMIDCVQFDRTTYQDPPWRFEAGTGNIADAVGLGAAIDYIQSIGLENIASHEHELLQYGTAGLLTVPGLRIIGTAENKAAVMSFVLAGHEPDDVGSYLDQHGIAVRAGHHCAQPILRRFGVTATVRPSLALYNTIEDLDRLVAALHKLQAAT